MNLYPLLERVRSRKPLVHHLTNWVTIYDCANIVKVFGASPVMAHAPEEAADMAALADALVLNIGTLTSDLIEAMKKAARAANKKEIPITLDVCGAGATPFRDKMCFSILDETRVDIIKGNASEIARIARENVTTKGVDSGRVEKDLAQIASALSAERSCAVVITGKRDIVSCCTKTFAVDNGCELLGSIVGSGCMAASVIGAFSAVEKDLAKAACAGLSCYEIAAQIAAQKCSGPGTFKEALYDAVHGLTKEQVETMQRVSQLA